MLQYDGGSLIGQRQPVRHATPVPPDQMDRQQMWWAAAQQAPPHRSADRGPVQMAPPVRPYVSPTARQQQFMTQQQQVAPQAARGQGFEQGTPQYDQFMAQQQEQAKAALALQASRFATQRLDALKRNMDRFPPELQAQIEQIQGLAQTDPAAAWRAISGAFANAARAQGFADPRAWIGM